MALTLTNEQVARMRDALARGMSVRAACGYVPCSTNTVLKWRQRYKNGFCGCGRPLHDDDCRTPRVDAEMRKRMIALRLEENLDTRIIAERFGVTVPQAFAALIGYPTGKRRSPATNDWTTDEDEAVRRLWPSADRDEIVDALPRRSWLSVRWRASVLKVSREVGVRKTVKAVHALVAELRETRELRKLTTSKLGELSGVTRQTITGYELGNMSPTLDKLAAWAKALGYEIGLVKVGPAERNAAPPTRPRPAAAIFRPQPRPQVRPRMPAPVRASGQDREADDSAVAEWIRTHGVTRCPTQAVAETRSMNGALQDLGEPQFDPEKGKWTRAPVATPVTHRNAR